MAGNRVVMSRPLFVSLIIFVVLLIDQTLKVWVKTHMHYAQEIPIMGQDWALIYFVENPGMAFGYTLKGDYGKLILSLFRVAAILFLFYYLKQLIKAHAGNGVLISFALILAGAIGNVVDSAFYGLIFSASPFHGGEVATLVPFGQGYAPFLHGKVVDMFFFRIWEGIYPEWLPYLGGRPFQFFKPVFNIADVAISVGVINILLFQRSFFQTISDENNAVPITSDTAGVPNSIAITGAIPTPDEPEIPGPSSPPDHQS